MTVIVLSQHEGSYYMTGDGRATEDWRGVCTDNFIKVHSGKDYIYGTCGNCSANVVVKALLAKTRDPIKLLKLMKHKDFKDILQDSSTLVATKKFGCYTLDISKSKVLFTPSAAEGDIILWDDGTLPQIAGSGYLNVRTLLAQKEKASPKEVIKAIEDSYKVNHTIGGKITQVRLKK